MMHSLIVSLENCPAAKKKKKKHKRPATQVQYIFPISNHPLPFILEKLTNLERTIAVDSEAKSNFIEPVGLQRSMKISIRAVKERRLTGSGLSITVAFFYSNAKSFFVKLPFFIYLFN